MHSESVRIGAAVWVQSCEGYDLPKGLPERSRVTVIGWQNFAGDVRDEQGVVWRLYLTQVQTGYVLFLDGERCGERHPKFASYLRHSLAAMTETLQKGNFTYSKFWLIRDIDNARWCLERNGFNPDEPPRGPVPELTSSPTRQVPNPRLPTSVGSPRRMNS